MNERMEHTREQLPPAASDPGNVPIEYLEQLAADQRRTIHNSVSRLRSATKYQIKQRLDLKQNLRRNFWPAAGAVTVGALMLGYNLTGIFARR